MSSPTHLPPDVAQCCCYRKAPASREYMYICVSVCLCVQSSVVMPNVLQSIGPLNRPYTCLQRRLLGGSHPHLSAVTRNESQCTPIHQAAQHGHLHCLKFLVRLAPPKAVFLWDNDCNTPTLLAIQVGVGRGGEGDWFIQPV